MMKHQTTNPMCDGCAACCRSQIRPPFRADEIDAIPAELRAEVLAAPLDDGDCLWLSDGRCIHNSSKPTACSKFKPGSGKCSGMIRRFGKVCDG